MNHQIAQIWTNIIIAVAAVAGIGLALYQNHETNVLVASASNAFKAATYPVVKFRNYQWYVQNTSPSCDNPAIGINSYYQNVSGVPVAVEKSAIEVFMGDRPIQTGPGEVNLDVPGASILAPGQALAVGFKHPEFPAVYKRMTGAGTGPNLNFRLAVTYRSLVTSEQFCYTAKVVVLDDCRLPAQQQFQVGNESIGPCVN